MDAQLTPDYLDLEKRSVASAIKVYLTDGSVLPESLVEYPLGHVKSSYAAERVRQKFVRNMRLMFKEAEIEGFIHAIEDQQDMNIADFINLFVRDVPVNFER